MCVVNIGMVWGWGLLAIVGEPSGPGANYLGLVFVNFLSHTANSVREGFTYNPGLLTAWVFFLPVSYFGYQVMLDRGVLTWRGVVRGVAVGVVEHALLIAGYVAFRDGIISEGTMIFMQLASNLLAWLVTRPL